jgi:pimeloyl-ACP methyl ester carboxylesterase
MLAGEHDNIVFIKIHDASISLARLMRDTPGEMVSVRETGHSIHAERPAYLARRIVRFLNVPGCASVALAGLGAVFRR